MKFVIFSLIFMFSVNTNINCDKFKTGKFEIESKYGGKILIKRTHKFQTETVTRNGNVVRYKIKWSDECNFILFDRKLLKGIEEISDINFRKELDKDTIYNEIIEINGTRSRVISKMKNFPDVIESITQKIE
ncbi:MAG: hypothetical protein V4548_01555 [Bacteroidota bacterium]